MCCEYSKRASGLNGFFGQMALATEYVYEIQIMECKEFVYGGLPNDSFEGTVEI
jgi:hypothetical protein